MTATPTASFQRDETAALPSREGPPRTVRPGVETSARSWARSIPLEDIDRSDDRFQSRFQVRDEELLQSVEREGQQTPVILWRDVRPYIVIDGFRRLDCLASLGRKKALAVFESRLDEESAFALAFSQNVRRKNLSPYEKANAIQTCLSRWGMGKHDAAQLLGLSKRQVDRYVELLEFPAPLQTAVEAGRLSMAQAVVLNRTAPQDLELWIDEAAATAISAVDLAKRISSDVKKKRRTVLLRRDASGFRVAAIRYRNDMPRAQKREIWNALEEALKIMASAKEGRGCR